jgi:hypothetical protein
MSNQRIHGLENLLTKVNNKLARSGKRVLSYSEFEVIYAVVAPSNPMTDESPQLAWIVRGRVAHEAGGAIGLSPGFEPREPHI